MTRQVAQAEINAFVKGLITEASPLTFPDNASLDEKNMVIHRDGSRRRRYGMDLEEDFVSIDSGQSVSSDTAYLSFNWKAPGGYAEKEFAVVQTGTRISFFDVTSTPISGNLLGTYNILSDSTEQCSLATVDGLLTVASGTGSIYVFNYDGSLSYTSDRLKIRDLFGVEDILDGEDLLDAGGLLTRPSTLTDAHLYNLRNQTFALPRKGMGAGGVIQDTLKPFYNANKVFQSNSDSAIPYLYAQTEITKDRNTVRYIDTDAFANPMGSYRAPMGYFIIDALKRGASRTEQEQKLRDTYPELVYSVSSLPADYTPGGATVVSGYGGRMFFGGFSSQITDGDSESPRLGSYLLFSRLVKHTSDIFKCYQDGDPTSKEDPDLVDTDGGFMRIDGAADIKGLYDLGEVLMVIAGNGVWSVSGGSGYGFKSTDYKVTKITSHGSVSGSSVVVVDNSLMFWGQDGIYSVAQNQYGDWTASNITTNTIQSYIDDIPYLSKVRAQGIFDSYTRTARWLINNYFGATGTPTELIFDTTLGAFYPAEFSKITDNYPIPVSYITVPPFRVSDEELLVSDSSNNIVADSSGDSLSVDSTVIDSDTSEIMYITALETSGNLTFTFSLYRDEDFLDWKSVDGTGVDAAAYLLTGWTGAGDYQRTKSIPYMTVYSIKTETGFDSDYNPTNPSSILVQSQWSWTNLAESGKWSPFFQAYRHRRMWMPSSSGSAFDDGEYVVTTRNKIRGSGRVISFLFKTEAGKDFYLLGWSLLMNVNGRP